MQAYLLIGKAQLQEEFLENFRKEKSVPSYHVTRFPEAFKIADARTLKNTLSMKTHVDESRLVIIENPTMDSQNALLKTIEELPERTYVFFLAQSKESLAATILSRVALIELEKTEIRADARIVEIFIKNEPDVSFVLQSFDFMSITPTEEELRIYIVSLREALLNRIVENKPTTSLLFYMKQLMKNYSLSETNNINKRMIGEASL